MLPESIAAASPIIAESKAARLALSPRQQAFVEFYARPGTVHGELALNASEAARRAGYSEHRANSTAQRLLKTPKVKAAVALIRKEVAERAGFTAEVAMRKLDQVIEHALKTDNASAHCRAVELQARIAGVLVDRIDARVAVGTFAINVHGLDGG